MKKRRIIIVVVVLILINAVIWGTEFLSVWKYNSFNIKEKISC